MVAVMMLGRACFQAVRALQHQTRHIGSAAHGTTPAPLADVSSSSARTHRKPATVIHCMLAQAQARADLCVALFNGILRMTRRPPYRGAGARPYSVVISCRRAAVSAASCCHSKRQRQLASRV